MKFNDLISFDNKVKIDNFVIYFKGLIFFKNYKAGVDSIKSFFNEYNVKFVDNLDALSGNFIVKIETGDNIYIFTDNSGMSRIYYDSNSASDSFLELIKYKKYKITDIDYFGIVEMIQFGANMFHTFIKNVNLLDRDKFILIKKGNMYIKNKQIFKLEYKKYDVENFYHNLKFNLDNFKIAVDLTAGTDSRLNCAMFSGNNINYDTTISGEKDCVDVIFSKKLSNVLNVNQYNLDYKININKEVFDEIFYNLDGQYSVLDIYKNYYLNNSLSKDNYDIRISGAGGEMYKYSWFAQDFPFLHKRKFDLNKVYNKRFVTSSLNKKYNKEFQKTINLYQKELKNNLEKYRKKTNSKTYDNLCYEVWMRNISSANLVNKRLKLVWYSPLLELKVARAGHNMNVFNRLNYMLHRKLVTKYCKKISTYKTNKGLTINNGFWYILIDNIKLFKEFIQIFIHKTKKIVIDTATSNKVFEDFYNYDEELVNILIDFKIIDENNIIDKKDTVFYSNLMTVARMLKYIKDKK